MSFCDYRSVGFIRERLLYKFTFLFKCSFKLERKRKKNLVKFLCFFLSFFHKDKCSTFVVAIPDSGFFPGNMQAFSCKFYIA